MVSAEDYAGYDPGVEASGYVEGAAEYKRQLDRAMVS